MTEASASVLGDEVARFDRLASRWWDPRGPMAPLHAMNRLRVDWVIRQLKGRADARLLDVGCGGGLAAEAFARRGLDVTGIDAAPEVIAAAEAHAATHAEGLLLAYRNTTAEALLAEGARFDVITALEVIEHVAEPAAFLQTLAAMLPAGGVLCLSTLNRTRRSYLMAKFGAEYVLRMLPVGTHDWSKFITPAELGGMLRRCGLRVVDVAGMRYALGSGAWRESRDTSVNYIVAAVKDAPGELGLT